MKNSIICLYGHIRKKSFILHLIRIFPEFKYYLHSWDELHPSGNTWHNNDNKIQKYITSKTFKYLISNIGYNNFLLESQDTSDINKIPVSRRKYYSMKKVLCLVKEINPIILVSRPDIIHHKKFNLNHYKIKKKQILCSFDLSKKRVSKFPEAIGCTDLILIGHKKDLIKLSNCLLNTKLSQNKFDDFEFMLNAIKGEDIDLVQIGYINERDFHIWRFNSRFRLKSIISNLKDYFYKLKLNLKLLFQINKKNFT